MNKYKIIIADDMEENLIRLEKILNGINSIDLVGKAKNGKEELEKILELHPDLVLSDNQMPLLNGIDVIEKIRNDIIMKIQNWILDLQNKYSDLKVYMPDMKLCTDNAAMIASAGYYNYIKGNLHELNLNAMPNLKIKERVI